MYKAIKRIMSLFGRKTHISVFLKDRDKPNEDWKYTYIVSNIYNSLPDSEKERIVSKTGMCRMTPVEVMRYEAFCKEHRKCHKALKSTIGGFDPLLIFIGTGLGNIVKCKCQQCNAMADITDIDSW